MVGMKEEGAGRWELAQILETGLTFLCIIVACVLGIFAHKKDPPTFISVVAASLTLWIAVVSIAVLFRRDGFTLIFDEMPGASFSYLFFAILALGVSGICFIGVIVFAFLYSDERIWAVWLELLCMVISLLIYVFYDVLMVSAVQKAYRRRLLELPKPNLWMVMIGKATPDDIAKFEKRHNFDKLVREWITAHKTSYSRVDLPVLVAILISILAALWIFFAYRSNPDVFRVFVAGIICFHCLLATYLFVVHCPEFVIRGLKKYVEKTIFILPTKCYECPILWEHRCVESIGEPYLDCEFVCPSLGTKGGRDYFINFKSSLGLC